MARKGGRGMMFGTLQIMPPGHMFQVFLKINSKTLNLHHTASTTWNVEERGKSNRDWDASKNKTTSLMMYINLSYRKSQVLLKIRRCVRSIKWKSLFEVLLTCKQNYYSLYHIWPVQGSHTCSKIKFKDFSKTFQAPFPQIRGPNTAQFGWGSMLITVIKLRIFKLRTRRVYRSSQTAVKHRDLNVWTLLSCSVL